MRRIRFYFDSDAGSIAYYIDLETKKVIVGHEKDGEFTEVTQDETFSNPGVLQRQISNLLAIELNRKT